MARYQLPVRPVVWVRPTQRITHAPTCAEVEGGAFDVSFVEYFWPEHECCGVGVGWHACGCDSHGFVPWRLSDISKAAQSSISDCHGFMSTRPMWCNSSANKDLSKTDL